MPITRATADKTLETPQGEGAYQIVEALTDKGFDTWWVGGGVRDMLLGVVPKDIDIATEATPEQIRATFEKTEDIGRAFGSMRVHRKGIAFEVTTFREDDEASDGRHPEAVVFGKREADAKRRDITVNAIYWNPISRELYDPFKGEEDLRERLIRIIGNPAMRIKHDGLRLLRVVRFRAILDGQYEPETYEALREQAGMIEAVSGYRQLEELEKMLLSSHPERALEDLWETGILEYFLPELSATKGIPQPGEFHREGDVWDHILECTKNFREEDTIDSRLAAIFHDTGKATTFSLKKRIRFEEHASVSGELAAKALDRLQAPAKRRDKIVWLVKHHMMMGSFFEMPEERKAHWYFHEWFPELLQLFYLDSAGTLPQDFELYKKIVQDYNRCVDSHPRPPKPLLTGVEVMEIAGLPSGKQVGDIIKALHDAQVRGEITSKQEAREFVKKHRSTL
jgi:poly(A) polymerase